MDKLSLLPLFILLAVIPFGVAAQNIASAIATLLLIWIIFKTRKSEWSWADFKSAFCYFSVPLLASLLVLLGIFVGEALNDKVASNQLSFSVLGYSGWVFLPPLIYLAYKDRLSSEVWGKLFKGLAVVGVIFALVTLSQLIWGWKLEGIVPVEAPLRARGFYSHPLTLAYVLILLYPMALGGVIQRPRVVTSWLFFLGIGVALYACQSRMVQAVAGLATVVALFYFAKGTKRLILAAALLAALATLSMTNNPVKQRFVATLVEGHDVRSGYPIDDRLSFWHVNFNMWREHPIWGHGLTQNQAYRIPYYEAVGLKDFDRPYEAHNMYLQIAVDGGLVAFLAFVTWLAWHGRVIALLASKSFVGKVALLTFGAFLVAAVAQNAFQDSEVRFLLTLLMAYIWLSQKSSVPAAKPLAP